MRGSIEKLAEDRWYCRVYLGRDPDTGKVLRHNEVVRGRREDAERRLRAILRQVDLGRFANPERITVDEFLDEWLAISVDGEPTGAWREDPDVPGRYLARMGELTGRLQRRGDTWQGELRRCARRFVSVRGTARDVAATLRRVDESADRVASAVRCPVLAVYHLIARRLEEERLEELVRCLPMEAAVGALVWDGIELRKL